LLRFQEASQAAVVFCQREDAFGEVTEYDPPHRMAGNGCGLGGLGEFLAERDNNGVVEG